MTPAIEVHCRVDYRAINGDVAGEHTSRVDTLSATGCTIRTGQVPDGEVLELRIYLPDGEWPLRIDYAKVTWGHWDGFTVEFLNIATKENQRLQDYLANVPLARRGISLWHDSEGLAGEESEVWDD